MDKSLAEREIDLWAEQSDALIDELEERMDSVTRQQDRMEDKLSCYGDLFEIKDERMSLESLQKQVDAIDRYEQALSSLQERGLSGGLMDEVLGMDVDEATQYAQKLLNMSDTQWDEYNDLWNEKQQRAAEVAEQFFKDQIDTLETEYSEKLGGALDELTEDAFNGGVDAAQGLIDGLASMEAEIEAKVSEIMSKMSKIFAQGGGVPTNAELAASFATERFQEQYLGVTPRDMQNVGAGVVNGVSAAVAGQGSGDLIVESKIDSTTFYRETIRNFRRVDAEDPGLGDDR